MASTMETDTDYLLNLFNIPKPNSKCASIPASPSPSAQSENSVECNQNTNDTVISSDEDSEQELTNLTWLTQLKNLAAWPDSVNPILDEDLNDKSKLTNILKKDTAADRFNKFIDQVVKSRTDYDASAELFQSNSEVKPTFNYAQIIAMAMHENGRMTLQQICSWIERKFAYFRARKNWNNSIRHNLSLHCCFRKIDRSKYEKGKGGYWELGIDITKCERKRVRNRKPRLNSNKDDCDAANNRPDMKRPKMVVNESTPQNVEEEVIQDFFGQEDLRDFSLETNLDVTSVIEQTLNEIEQDEIYHSEKAIPRSDDELNAAVSSITPEELHTSFVSEENFLSSNDGVSSTIEMLREELQNGGGTMVDPTTMNIHQNEIFLANEVPQPSENVVISILNNHPCGGPNVIVEPIPYASIPSEDTYKPYFDGIDEEFQFLRNCENRDDLIDSLYDIATNDF